MAGTFIPIQDDLARCKQVFRIAAKTKMSRHEVTGLCCEFWGWASVEAEDGETEGTVEGLLRDVSVDALVDALTTDRSTAKKYFAAMKSVGWLVVRDDGVLIPEYKRWFSKKAKARLLRNMRQDRYRKKQTKTSTELSTEV